MLGVGFLFLVLNRIFYAEMPFWWIGGSDHFSAR